MPTNVIGQNDKSGVAIWTLAFVVVEVIQYAPQLTEQAITVNQ